MSELNAEYTVRRNMQTTYVDSCVIVAVNSDIDDVLPALLFDLDDYCHLVFISSSPGSRHDEVRDGLISQGFMHPTLIMREEGDSRKDAVVKEEIYEDIIKPNYNVHLVFDAQDQDVEMWRSKGLTCYQVADGDF